VGGRNVGPSGAEIRRENMALTTIETDTLESFRVSYENARRAYRAAVDARDRARTQYEKAWAAYDEASTELEVAKIKEARRAG
jgi:hypothetical protein